MNRQSQGSLPVSKATVSFLQYKAAEGLSPNTLQSYQRDLKLWQIYARDLPVHQLTTKLIQDFFVWLRTDYQPRRLSGNRTTQTATITSTQVTNYVYDPANHLTSLNGQAYTWDDNPTPLRCGDFAVIWSTTVRRRTLSRKRRAGPAAIKRIN